MSSGAERYKGRANNGSGADARPGQAAEQRATKDAADREAARDVAIARVVEPTGALAAYLSTRRTAERLRRAAEDGRLSQAAASAAASPRGLHVLVAAAIALPLALLLAIGVGGTLVGWAAPSAAARAVGAARGLLGALGLAGDAPWLPAARDMAAYWAARGAADRGVVFAAAADASALLSAALAPSVVFVWAAEARSRFAPLLPPDPKLLRRGRLFGAGAAAGMVVMVWCCAHLLVYGYFASERAAQPGDFRASFIAPAWWALMALCGPLFAAGLPSFVVCHVIRPPAR